MSHDEAQHAGAGLPHLDAPQADGEQLVSFLRIVLSLVIVIFIVGYVMHTAETTFVAFYWSGVGALCWSLMSTLYLAVIKRGHYRPWMSYISTLADLLVFTTILVAMTVALPLQFAHGPAPTLYFLVIGLAALRRSRKLVLLSGVASGVALLAVSATATAVNLGTGQVLAQIKGHPMDFNIVDQVVKAGIIAATAVIIAHVTGALRRSERQYRQLFENVPDGIAIIAKDQSIIKVNHRFAEMVGRGADALVGRKIGELFTRGPVGRGTPTTGVMGSPMSLIRSDGAEIPVRTAAVPMSYRGQDCVEMSVRDVGVQVLLQQRLAQSQKMETIGRLASGLARDFDDHLAGIVTAAHEAERVAALVEEPRAREKLSRQIGVIEDCGASAKEVIARLLGRPDAGLREAHPVDLGQILTDVAAICRNTFGERYSIQVEVPDEPATVRADGTSLTQALLNLCINARDAMPGGGSIALRLTASDPADAVWQKIPIADVGSGYWCVETTDEGSGMDPETVEKIFDPFFSTKPPGQGTGLGLSMVYNIVRQHRGFVDVSSRSGVGSTFRLLLPRDVGPGYSERDPR